MKKYALYKGEEFITEGSIAQIAKVANLKEGTLRFYLSPIHKKRISSQKNGDKQFIVIRTDETVKGKVKKSGRELAQEYVDIILEKGITQAELARLVGRKETTVSKTINTYFKNDNPQDKKIMEKIRQISNMHRSLSYKKTINNRVVKKEKPIKTIENFFEYRCGDLEREDAVNQALKIFNISEYDVRLKYNAWRKKFVES